MVDMHSSSCSPYPSFSSTLLDSIYRSIDRGDGEMGICRQPINKDSYSSANFQRACMIEKWMENKIGEKLANSQVKQSRKNPSFSSSSDSSGDFNLHGEAESFRQTPVLRLKTSWTGGSRHETGETGKNRRDFEINRRLFPDQFEQKPKHENGFLKTKSKALKIYGDLKKAKQPLSPGGKVAAFLNSLLTTAGYSKKHKTTDHSPKSKSENFSSTCSSASSFSRSCLTKTPQKSQKIENRSVTFLPVSVIANDNFPQRGHKPLPQQPKTEKRNLKLTKGENSVNHIDEEFMAHVIEYNRRVEDAAMDFLRKTCLENGELMEELDEDLESCASSDLFELPVYETSCVDAKRSIMK